MRRGREEAAENGGSAGEEGGRLVRGEVLFSHVKRGRTEEMTWGLYAKPIEIAPVFTGAIFAFLPVTTTIKLGLTWA